jgi:hypothetical protein
MFFLTNFKKFSITQVIYGCAWLLVMGLFSTHAQAKCTLSVVNENNKPLNTFMARSPGSSSQPLLKQTVTASYSNCDAPISNLVCNITLPTLISQNGTVINATGTPAFFFGRQLRCFASIIGRMNCTDATNSAITGGENSGISYTLEANVVSACPGKITTSTSATNLTIFGLTTGTNICNAFQVVYVLTIFRGSDSIPTNINQVTFVPFFDFTITAASTTDSTLGFSAQTLFSLVNRVFTYSDTTCALTLSPSTLNLGNFLLSTIQSTPVNTTIPKSNLPLNITISNCKGGAVGANKVFLVQFTTPRATDSTLMDNETTSAAGGNTGISARITADSRLDVSTQTPLPNVVKSGESFITSAGTTDSKTMTYTVEFVRNSDTATTGAFSSSAVFTMSYQ